MSFDCCRQEPVNIGANESSGHRDCDQRESGGKGTAGVEEALIDTTRNSTAGRAVVRRGRVCCWT